MLTKLQQKKLKEMREAAEEVKSWETLLSEEIDSQKTDWLKVIAGGITGAFIFWLFWVITLSL